MGAFNQQPQQQNPLLGILGALSGAFNPQMAQGGPQFGPMLRSDPTVEQGPQGLVGASGQFGVGNPVFQRFYEALTQQMGGTAPVVGQALGDDAILGARRSLLGAGDEEAAFGIFGGGFGDPAGFLDAARQGRGALQGFLGSPRLGGQLGGGAGRLGDQLGVPPAPQIAPVSTVRQQQPLATTLGQPAPESRVLGGASGASPFGFPALNKRNPFGSFF